jgi:transposase
MNDEYLDRLRAIKLYLAGQSAEEICRTLDRSREWFHTWRRRYLAAGPQGLLDVTRAHPSPLRIPPELERTILNIRRRLEAQLPPKTRYSQIGATAILAELKLLQVRSLPCPRTIERVLQRNGITVPKVRLARLLSSSSYPAPQAETSNDLHQVDCVGPLYLKGNRQRYYIFVCKDVFDGAVYLKLSRSRKMDAVLAFLGECWKTLGQPTQMQFDNAREFVGWGRGARSLSRVIRLCLRVGIEPMFIPPAQPQFNGSVENFNGWFQSQLFQRRFTQPSALKRELQRLQETVNTQHVHPRLGGLTPAQFRRRQKLQLLPTRFRVPLEAVPIAMGRVIFIRQVTPNGNLHLLGLTFKVGKRLKGQYVKAILDTHRRRLTVYRAGRVIKFWPYPYLTK